MANVIQTMINGALGDGARSTKYECILGFESFKGMDKTVATLVKTSSFPGKQHNVIDLKYKGKNIPIRGETIYDNSWSCTFYLTEDHALKKQFEDYMENLDYHGYKGNTNTKKNYTTTATIIQLDFDGSQETATYRLYNVFPKSVSAVEVDYSEVGKVQEFTVEFSYSHFDSLNKKSGNGSWIDETKDRFLNALDSVVQKGKQVVMDNISGLLSSATDAFMSSGAGSGFKSVGESISNGIGSLEQLDFSEYNMFK